MKKITAILMSAMMLLAFASCDSGKEGGSSENASVTSSEVSSEAPSETSSEPLDPNAPLTADEIAKIIAAGDAMEGTDAVDLSMDVAMTVDMFGTSTSTNMKMAMVKKGQEVYEETSASSFGIEQKEIVYFKDGKYYTITSIDGEAEGFYEELTYEEAFPENETSENTAFILDEETLAEAEIERSEDGSTTIFYDGDSESFITAMEESFAASMAEEGYNIELTDAEYSIVFDKDYTVKSMKIGFKMLMVMETEGMELSMAYDIVMDITLNAYGENADITVPVPENLDDCEKLDFGEEF